MRVQLVFSPAAITIRHAELPKSLLPPLGILYLAAFIREHMPHVELRATDGLLEGWDRTIQAIRDFSPDVLLVSYVTPCALSAYKLATAIKAESPEIKVVFGGPHATTMPKEAFAMSPCDFLVVGEGEQTVLELVQAMDRGLTSFEHVNGLVWRHSSVIVTNPPREFITDVNTIPFPARDLIDMSRYTGWFIAKQRPETSILTSRGCPFDCTFCSNIIWKSGKPWQRLRSPDNIVKEIEGLKKSFGIREFFDNADEFNARVPHALAVCEAMTARRLNVTWKAQLRAAPLPEDLVRAMAKSGCWYVHLGIESGNERTLRGIHKHITLDQVVDACKLLKKHGIRVFGLLMLFNAWEEDGALAFEDLKETQRTLDFGKMLVDKRLIDYANFSITTPYPGSALYDIAGRHNLFRKGYETDWDRWLVDEDFTMQLPGIDLRMVKRLHFRASLIRAKSYLLSGHWRLGDAWHYVNRALRSIRAGLGR